MRKETALAAADINCPSCGSENGVRVAGVYESPRTPANWYCRCDHCRRGFNARPKEDGGDGMAHGDKTAAARQTLPAAELERMIRQGMTDPEVAEVTNLGLHMIKKLKREYQLTGIVGRRNQSIVRKERENMAFETMPRAIKSEGEIQVEQPTEGRTLTITAALEHRTKMTLEAESIKVLIEHTQGLELTPGVLALLKGYQEDCNSDLERVTKAFETVEISI